MSDYAKLKELAEAATQGEWTHSRHGVIHGGPVQEFCNGSGQQQIVMTTGAEWMSDGEKERNASYIAAANPAVVLGLLDDLASTQKIIDKAWNRSTPALEGHIPGALDAWKRPVMQHLPYDFSGNPGASATQYCNGWNDSGGYWKNHCSDLHAEIDQLKAECEGLRAVMACVISEIPRGYSRGNAPGHGHDIPGIWDRDNGDKSGKECGWCKVWNTAISMSKGAQS